MRRPFVPVLCGLVAAVGSVVARPSSARASWIAKAAGGDARIEEVRLAHVAAPGRSVVFAQLSLVDVRGETVWILPVPEGGFVEPAGPRVFAALEEATAPVLAPLASLQCGAILRTTADDLASAPARPIARGLGTVLAREAPARLTAGGFVVDEATEKALLGADEGARVSLLVLQPWVAGPTATVRVVSGPRATVPLGLTGPRLRWFGIGPGRPGIGRPEIEPAFGALTWGSEGSSWPAVLAAARADATAAGGIVATFAARDGLFSDQALVAGATLGSFVRRHAKNEACAARAAAFALRATPLPVPCPRAPAWPSADPVPACTPTPGPLDDLVCDGDDDLAAAFGGTVPAQLWLSRLLGDAGGVAAPSDVATGSLRSFHQVLLGGTPACTPIPPPDPTTPAVTPPSSAPPTEPVDDATADACGAAATGLAEGCAAAAADGACTASDPTPAEDGPEGCGGDTTDGEGGCHVVRRGKRLRAWPVAYALVAIAAALRRRSRPGGAAAPRRGLREPQG